MARALTCPTAHQALRDGRDNIADADPVLGPVGHQALRDECCDKAVTPPTPECNALWTHTFTETDGPSTSARFSYAPIKEIDDDSAGGIIPLGVLPIDVPLRLLVSGECAASVVSAGFVKQVWCIVDDVIGQNFFGDSTNGGMNGQLGRAYTSAGASFAPIALVNEPVGTDGTAGDPYITFRYLGGNLAIYLGTVYDKANLRAQTARIQNYTLTICQPS